MSCRHGHLLLAFVLGLLAPLGCARWQFRDSPLMINEHPAGPNVRPGELSSDQAAQLCLTAGEALEQRGFTAEALAQYENARKYDPQMPAVARHLAVLYDLQGDAARAEMEYGRALQEQPGDAELLNDFGYFHYRHNQLQTAENWLRKAIATDPNCAWAWSNLGQVLACEGRPEESYEAFVHVLRPAEAYSNLGILLAKQGRTAEARNALQQAIQLAPDLKQPRAFLNALPDTPRPLPSGLTQTSPSSSVETAQSPPLADPATSEQGETAPAAPARMPQPAPREEISSTLPYNDLSATASFVNSEAVAPPRAPNPVQKSVPPAPPTSEPAPMEWTPPNRTSATPAVERPPAVSSRPPEPSARPTVVAAARPALPMIVNGPIQPRPIAIQRAAAKEQASAGKTSLTAAPEPPSLPPPAPLASPPLPVHPSADTDTEGPILIQTRAAALQSVGPPPSPTMPPPSPMPPLPSSVPLTHKPLPRYLLTVTQPQAVLTDCHGDQDPDKK